MLKQHHLHKNTYYLLIFTISFAATFIISFVLNNMAPANAFWNAIAIAGFSTLMAVVSFEIGRKVRK